MSLAGGATRVIIAEGSYTGDGNRDIDFDGRAIRVRSTSGDPTTCVIDCEGTDDVPHRGFCFRMRERANSVLEGVTIAGGYVNMDGPNLEAGGGILCFTSSPTIRNCIIRDNVSRRFGWRCLLRPGL